MVELIRDLEVATEGSRELDGRVLQAVYPKAERRHASWYIDDIRIELEPFTTSLDAALTLVPEKCHWNVTGRNGARVGKVCASGATPALALCIAALKAQKEAHHE